MRADYLAAPWQFRRTPHGNQKGYWTSDELAKCNKSDTGPLDRCAGQDPAIGGPNHSGHECNCPSDCLVLALALALALTTDLAPLVALTRGLALGCIASGSWQGHGHPMAVDLGQSERHCDAVLLQA